ncbi:MAG: response regulator [Acidobacteria bacterium]|nr:response regulator [Acidobacteriota bacterium]
MCAILESRRGTALWLDGGRDAGPRFTHAVLPRIRCPLGCRSGRHTPNVVCHGRAALEAYGYRVITACDGAAAVALYAQRQAEVQLLLTDLMMPMMDGVTLIRTLRQRHPALRVICCSGTAGAMENPELEQLGVHRILAKPLNADTLLRAVAQILNET